MKAYLEAGKVVNTHGIRGEVKIQPWADSPDFLKDFKVLYIEEKPLNVLASRVHKSNLIVTFQGINNVNAAMSLKGKTVFINRHDAKLPDGSFFIQDILGSRVMSEDGSFLGILEDVMESPASNIYVVKGQREILIPAVPYFIIDTDVKNKLITVRLIGGM